MITRHERRRLDLPADRGLRLPAWPALDSEQFGRASEGIARFFGTARYLALQSVIVVVWILLNLLPALKVIRWDHYPFVLLNLVFSTQAAYAAPLILLAQSRQADRDRVQIESDRASAAQQKAEAEFLSREIAGVRVAQRDAATRDFIRGEVAAQLAELRRDLQADMREAVRHVAVDVSSQAS